MSRTKRADHPRRQAANLTRALAVQDLRSSGAAGPHDPRPRRERTRSRAVAAEMRINGWDR